jgi:hypothetical protein
MSWCSDAPEDEAISLFAGLLANPDVRLSPGETRSSIFWLLLFVSHASSYCLHLSFVARQRRQTIVVINRCIWKA